EQAQKEGKGVVLVDGKLVENLHVESAKRLVGMADAIAAMAKGYFPRACLSIHRVSRCPTRHPAHSRRMATAPNVRARPAAVLRAATGAVGRRQCRVTC